MEKRVNRCRWYPGAGADDNGHSFQTLGFSLRFPTLESKRQWTTVRRTRSITASIDLTFCSRLQSCSQSCHSVQLYGFSNPIATFDQHQPQTLAAPASETMLCQTTAMPDSHSTCTLPVIHDAFGGRSGCRLCNAHSHEFDPVSPYSSSPAVSSAEVAFIVVGDDEQMM